MKRISRAISVLNTIKTPIVRSDTVKTEIASFDRKNSIFQNIKDQRDEIQSSLPKAPSRSRL